jgi:hypothetical protein
MKRRLLYALLVLEAALCITLSLAKNSFGGAFSALLAFPFEQIGLGLRLLSLTGKLGNSIALTLYAAFCLLPAFFLLRDGKGGNFTWRMRYWGCFPPRCSYRFTS